MSERSEAIEHARQILVLKIVECAGEEGFTEDAIVRLGMLMEEELAAARNALPELIAEIEEARNELAKWHIGHRPCKTCGVLRALRSDPPFDGACVLCVARAALTPEPQQP